MSYNIEYPMNGDIVDSVRELTSAASDFKTSIFKAKMRGEVINQSASKKFLRVANEFLKRWDDYSEGLEDAMKHSKGAEDVYTIEYGYVKNYLFAKYDYAAVLPFADGVFQGVKSSKFEDPDDVEDFRDHTTDKAFPDLADSVAGLVNDVVDGGIDNHPSKPAGKLGLSKYQSVRQSGKIFNHHNRGELYNAVKKTVEYLIDHMDDLQVNEAYSGTRLYVSAINNIVDFGVYSMVAFAMRIVVIGRYAIPFINAADSTEEPADDPDAPMVESVQKLPDEHYNCTDCVHIMKDADDARMKAPACIKEFVDTFGEFLTEIGAIPKIGEKPSYERPFVSPSMREGNRFYEKLKDNSVFDLIFDYPYHVRDRIQVGGSYYNELVVTMRDFMYDHKLALPNNNSPREEYLHVIRGTEAEQQSVKGYQKLAYDLYIIMMMTVMNMDRIIRDITEAEIREKNNPTTNIGSVNDCAECLRIMNYVYRELTWAYLQKARYIEAKINFLKEENLNKAIAGMQVHIPGMKPDEPSMNDYMMASVPDTVKMPVDLADLYELPVFEALEMYDISLRYKPEFADNLYLSEAVGISNLINAIIAAIQGAFNKFKNFFNDRSVQSAVKWVNDHGDQLAQMDFTGKKLEVLPYKDKIDFGAYAQKLIKGINGFDAGNNAPKTAEQVTAFIKTLYPSDNVYAFYSGDDKKVGAQKYRNLLLFQEEAQVTDKPVAKVTYEGQTLQAKVKVWVETLKSASNTFNAYNQLTKELNTAVNSLKAKVVSVTNQQSKQNDSQTPPPAPPAAGATQQQQPQPQQDQQQNKMDEANSTLNTVLVDTQTAINRIWIPATDMFVEYIKAHYNYLKEAYGLVNNGQAQNGQPQPNPNNAQ